MKLSTGLNQFFVQYLPHIKGSRQTTIHAYRDTYRLFLPFAADYYHIKITSLRIEHLNVELIITFLNYLEEDRKNTARTRNLRLVAIKSLAKMMRLMYPQYRKRAEQILSIPQKRMQKKLIGYLYPEEIMDVFKAVDLKKNEGFRDYCLLHLLFDSGARATEIATLNLDYFDAHNQTLAILGKGNRFRQIELWPKTRNLKIQIHPECPYRHPRQCSVPEIRLQILKIAWDMKISTPPWFIYIWICLTNGRCRKNLFNTPNQVSNTIQSWMSSSIGITEKISWHGSTGSDHGMGHGWVWEGVSANTNYYVATFFTNL